MTQSSLLARRSESKEAYRRLPVLFHLGHVVVSEAAKSQLELFELNHCACCHQRGGFLRRGECDNPTALFELVANDAEVVTRYRTRSGLIVRVTTDAERTHTVIDLDTDE